jgi:hypothetical protein
MGRSVVRFPQGYALYVYLLELGGFPIYTLPASQAYSQSWLPTNHARMYQFSHGIPLDRLG